MVTNDEARWVCDGCMRSVARDQIAEMADGEHVLCGWCWRDEQPGQVLDRLRTAETQVDAIKALIGYSGLSVNHNDPAIYRGHDDERPAFVDGWNYAMRDYDARVRAILDGTP